MLERECGDEVCLRGCEVVGSWCLVTQQSARDLLQTKGDENISKFVQYAF